MRQRLRNVDPSAQDVRVIRVVWVSRVPKSLPKSSLMGS